MTDIELSYRKNYNYLIQHTTARTGDVEKSKDLVQDAYVKMIEYFDRYGKSMKIINTTFPFLLIKQFIINEFRASTADKRNEKYLKDRKNYCEQENEIDYQRLINLLKDIPHFDIFLDFINGYKYRELAEKYNEKIGTIKAWIHRFRDESQIKLLTLK